MSKKDSFSVQPSKIELKGKPRGLTTFSKKFKGILAVFGGIIFLIVVLATISTWDDGSSDTQQQGAEPKEGDPAARQAKSKPQTMNFDKLYDEHSERVKENKAASVPSPLGTTTQDPAGVGPAASVPPIAGATKGQSPTNAAGAAAAGGSPLGGGSGGGGGGREMTDAQRNEEQKKMVAKMAGSAVDGWPAGDLGGDGATKRFDAVRDSLQGAMESLKSAAAGGAGMMVPGAPQQDDQNKQVRKEEFLKAAQQVADRTTLIQTVKPPISPYVVTLGMRIPAALGCSVNTDLPGQICAVVTQTVHDKVTGRYPLIPQGTEVFGTYDSRVALGQRRTLVVWSRLQFANGERLELEGMPGADASGAAGFDAEVDNHYGKVVGTMALASLFAGALQMSQSSNGSQGGSQQYPSVGQSMASAAGQQIAQTGSAVVQRQLQIQPTLSNEPGYRFIINVTKDIVFAAPYAHVRR